MCGQGPSQFIVGRSGPPTKPALGHPFLAKPVIRRNRLCRV